MDKPPILEQLSARRKFKPHGPKEKATTEGTPHTSLPPRAVSPVDVAMETRGSKRIKRSADVDAATPGCLGCADLKTELGQLKTELSELKTELGDYKAVCEANARNLSKLPQLSCRLSEGDPGVLLGALIRELPEVFEAEVLSKLDCKDHFSLALVNKACKYSIYKVEPIACMRSFGVKPLTKKLKRPDGTSTPITDREFRLLRAANEGRLDVLKWLFEKGCPMDLNLCTLGERCALGAVFSGNVHMLQWMKDNGMTGEWRESHMFSAANSGSLEVVKWLHVNGCPWDEKACLFAGARTHWDILQYLVDNKCPGWEKAAITYAEHLTINPGDDE